MDYFRKTVATVLTKEVYINSKRKFMRRLV